MNFFKGRVGIMIVRDPSSRCDRPMCQICFGYVKEIRKVFLFGVSKKQGEGSTRPPPLTHSVLLQFSKEELSCTHLCCLIIKKRAVNDRMEEIKPE